VRGSRVDARCCAAHACGVSPGHHTLPLQSHLRAPPAPQPTPFATCLVSPRTHCAPACRNADVEAQISHLRAQLLRSEQDNELMRVKLEQETAEREKAQKQVRGRRGACTRLLLVPLAARPRACLTCVLDTCARASHGCRWRWRRRSCLSSRRTRHCRARTAGARRGARGAPRGRRRHCQA
jgi:hypothetical protein